MSLFVFRPAGLSLAALALVAASPAQAQGFLKNLAREAAYRAAVNGSTQPPQPQGQVAVASAADASGGDGAGEAEPAAAAAAAGPAPWPTNLGSREAISPGRLTFSPELEAQKKAFLEFSKVPCTACEGGHSYDAWAQHFIRLDGSWKAWEKKVGALGMGQSVTWQGSRSKGAITVVGEAPVGAWPCKQLKWTLTRPDAKAERLGLICNARPEGNPDWTFAL